MTTKTTGQQEGDVWNLYANGYLAQTFDFPQADVVDFSIEAFGSPLAGVWPNLEVRVDQMVVADIRVSSATLQTYRATASVPAGTHQVVLAFTNDAVGGGEDRNLYLKSLTIAGRSTSTTTPTPTPTPTSTATSPTPAPPPPSPTSGFDVKSFLAHYGPGLPHEGNPSGVPTSWDWATHAGDEPSLTAPPNTGSVNWWSVVAVDLTEQRPANTRVEFRGGKLLVLAVGSNTWTTELADDPIGGGGFKADFTGGCTYGGVSLGLGDISLDPQPRCLDHFWPSNPAFLAIPANAVRAAISVGAVRLIKADPNGVDDRASSHFLVQMGSDWRSADGNCPKNASGELVCSGVVGGRFIYPKVTWRAAVASTMKAADLAALPLPPAEMFRLPDGSLPTE
jgi:hypothetical protein